MAAERTVTVRLVRLHAGQRQVYREALRFNVVACGRRWGKTLLGINLACEAALAGQPVAWYAPTYKDAAVAWGLLKRALYHVITRSSEQEKRLELLTGGVLEVWTLDNPDSSRGRYYGRVIIDEAAKVARLREAWTQTVRPTLTDLRGDAWFLSTPRGRNYFWTLYGMAQHYDDWRAWCRPTADNPYLSPEEIEAARVQLPERVFRQEYLAEFLDDGGSVFRNVEAAQTAPYPADPRQHARHRLIVGADWGKNNDYTALAVVCATCRQQVDLERFNRVDYALQEARLMQLVERWGGVRQVIVHAETNAMGEPIVEQLQRRGLAVRGFTTTAASKPPLIESLALAIERGELQLQPHSVQTHELLAYTMTLNKVTGRPSYSAPEGGHDDTVMALALAWALCVRGVLVY